MKMLLKIILHAVIGFLLGFGLGILWAEQAMKAAIQ